MAAGTVDDLDDAQAAALRTLRARLQEKPPVEGADVPGHFLLSLVMLIIE